MIERKPDAARIEAHLDRLRQASWIGPARQWWPKFVFHFAELQNVVRILREGKLVCRSRRPMAVDTGSPDVLSKTADEWKDYVRLYFRPRTPTQHQIEGFRPAGQYDTLGQHMPMPVYLLFDAKDILTRKTTKFSTGNLAQNPPVGDDGGFLENIPFEKVYHDGPMAQEEKGTIKFHRHAEVIAPGELDLGALQFIWCRSAAEYQTLLHLLTPQLLRTHRAKIRQGRRPNLHFCKWTFVESASLDQGRISFMFNPSTLTAGPFAAHLAVVNCRTDEKYKWQNPHFEAKNPLTIGIPQIQEPSAYQATLTLDGALAYAGSFSPTRISF